MSHDRPQKKRKRKAQSAGDVLKSRPEQSVLDSIGHGKGTSSALDAAANAGSEGKSVRKHAFGCKKNSWTTLTKQICSFVEWPAYGIVALAVDPSGSQIAVARMGGRLELRDSRHGWIAVSSVPIAVPEQEGISVTKLAFMGPKYLWAARMDGALELWEIVQDGLRSVCVLHLGGGALWDLCILGARVAVACDDGSVRVVEVDPVHSPEFPSRDVSQIDLPRNEFAYTIRASPKTKHRVLCLASHENIIVCGDARGGLRWLDAQSLSIMGRAVNRGVHIWCLCFAKNGQDVVCGDSSGVLTVWSSKTHALVQEVAVEGLHGDVLSIAACGGGKSDEVLLVGCAGGTIGGVMAPANAKPGDPWIPLRAKRFHTHDIRALAHIVPSATTSTRYSSNAGAMFLSGSLDSSVCQIPISSLLKDLPPTRVRPFPGPAVQPHVQFIARNSAVLCRYPDRIDVWRVYSECSPALLLRLSLKSMEGTIRSCAASENLGIIAVSGARHARVFRVIQERTHPKKRRRKTAIDDAAGIGPFSAKIEPVAGTENDDLSSLYANSPDMVVMGRMQCIAGISSDGKYLVVSGPFSEGCSRSHVRLSMKKLKCADSVDRLVRVFSSPAANCRFALLNSMGILSVFDIPYAEKGNLDPVLLCSKSTRGKVVATAFSADGEKLAFATSAGDASVMTAKTGALANLNFPQSIARNAICLSFSPQARCLVLCTDNCCAVSVLSGSKRESYGDDVKSLKFLDKDHSVLELGKHENILGASVMGKNRLVLVQRPWKLVVSSLPPVLSRKLFGT